MEEYDGFHNIENLTVSQKLKEMFLYSWTAARFEKCDSQVISFDLCKNEPGVAQYQYQNIEPNRASVACE